MLVTAGRWRQTVKGNRARIPEGRSGQGGFGNFLHLLLSTRPAAFPGMLPGNSVPHP
jgi:hypothetical protein